MEHRSGGQNEKGTEQLEFENSIRRVSELENRDQGRIDAVQRMQDAIRMKAEDPAFSAEDVYAASGYSPRHAERLFRAYAGRPVAEYLRAVRLSNSSERLLRSRDAILQIAMDAGFDSHEGFTRAFCRSFRVNPQAYRKEPVPIPLFVQNSLRAYQTLKQHMEGTNMEQEKQTSVTICTVLSEQRPKRKLMLLRGIKAEDYWTFCEERGCDWTGLMNSIPEKLDICGLVELPEHLVKPGTSAVCAGVELPAGYDAGKVPEGYDLIDLAPCEMLCFQTEPYEDEQAFCEAIEAAQRAVERYDPKRYGYEYAFDAAPKYNYGADTGTGARLALPVRRI